MTLKHTINALIDKNVDWRKIKWFKEKYKLSNIIISFYRLNIENESTKIKDVSALALFDHPKGFDTNRFCSETEKFTKTTAIVGKNNIKDCLHIESCNFYKFQYLITNDNDILSKLSPLESLYPNIKILNLGKFGDEIKKLCKTSDDVDDG